MVFQPNLLNTALPGIQATLPVGNSRDEQFQNIASGIASGLQGLGSLRSGQANLSNALLAKKEYIKLLRGVPGLQKQLNLDDPRLAYLYAKNFSFGSAIDQDKVNKKNQAGAKYLQYVNTQKEKEAEIPPSNLPQDLISESNKERIALPSLSQLQLDNIPQDQRFTPQAPLNYTPGVALPGRIQEEGLSSQSLITPNLGRVGTQPAPKLPSLTQQALTELQSLKAFEAEDPTNAALIKADVLDTIGKYATAGKTVQETGESTQKAPLEVSKLEADLIAKLKEEEAKDKPFKDSGKTVREQQEIAKGEKTALFGGAPIDKDSISLAKSLIASEYPELQTLLGLGIKGQTQEQLGKELTPEEQKVKMAINSILIDLAQTIKDKGDKGPDVEIAREKIRGIRDAAAARGIIKSTNQTTAGGPPGQSSVVPQPGFFGNLGNQLSPIFGGMSGNQQNNQ